MVVLGRWSLRIGTRRFAREALHTLQGRLMLLVAVLAAPSLVILLGSGGPMEEVELVPIERLGALTLAHLCAIATCAVMVPVLLGKELVLRDQSEPVEAHPAFLRDLVVVRVAGVLLSCSAFLTLFLHLFHWRVVLELGGPGLATLPAHLASTLALLAVLGLLFAGAWRTVLRGPHAREWTERVRGLSILPFALFFPAIVLAPSLLARHGPVWLTTLGEAARDSGYFLVVPLAVADPASGGAWIRSLVWPGTAGVAVVAASALLLGWRETAMTEALSARQSRPPERRPMRLRVPRGAPGWLRDLLVFWAKDIGAAAGSRGAGRVRLHGFFFGLVVVGLLGAQKLGMYYGSRTNIVHAALLALTTGVSAAFGMIRGLPCLGREGDRVALLRPVLSPIRLLRAKAGVNAAYVAVVTVPHALLAHATAAFLGADVGSPLPTVTVAVVVGTTLSLVGTGVGFLLPDPDRRSPLLPGASLSGRTVYGTVAGSAMCGVAAVSLLRARGVLGRLEGVAALTALLAGLLGLAAVLGAWALRREAMGR